MGWYNDKISDSAAQLALSGAGAGAKALAALAKIPLDIDDRKLRDKKLKLQQDETRNKLIAAQVKAGATIEAATKRADAAMKVAGLRRDGTHETNVARIVVADRGVTGKKITAGAKDRATSAGERNNKRTNATKYDITQIKAITDTNRAYTQKEIAEINKRAKKPVEVVTYDEQGHVITRKVTQPKKIDRMAPLPIDALSREGKRLKAAAAKKKKKSSWFSW